MSDGLKWARRLRLELAFEIEQLETGVRKVTHMTAHGSVDVTEQTVAALKDRFEQVEKLIAAFGPAEPGD
jgi:hypothetical protein